MWRAMLAGSYAMELRRAAYWLLGARKPIREEYPEWDDATQSVRWVDTMVWRSRLTPS
jgi:hypothetical protein